MRHASAPQAPCCSLWEQLPLSRISPRPTLQHAQEACSLERLAESIRRYGLMRPVTVRRQENGRYIVVSGNRRLMACRMLGMSCISVWILSDQIRRQSREALLEALLTRRLHYLEEAEALEALHEVHGMPLKELSDALGLPRRTLENQMSLTRLTDEMRALLLEEGIPLAIAVTLLRLPETEKRMQVALRIVQERLCIRDAALMVSAMLRGKPEGRIPAKTESRYGNGKSQNNTRMVIGVIRDQRLYLNAIRNLTGQMQAAGFRATVAEQEKCGRLEMTISVPLRRRRADRYQSV